MRHLKFTWVFLAMLTACASTPPSNPNAGAMAKPPTSQSQDTFSENELTAAVSSHLGVTAEAAGSMVERLFSSQGRPVGYITGEEAGGAFIAGLRYGKGKLWMKSGHNQDVYWQGPSVGFDWGANGSKVFTLVYNLQDPNYIYQRFPGVDGSAYAVAGLAVNYQRANNITLAPIRTGVGLRLGANIGYLAYSRKRSYVPF